MMPISSLLTRPFSSPRSNTRRPRALRAAGTALCLALLAACGSTPPETISLPSKQAGPSVQKGDVEVKSIEWKRSKPNCKGDDCPRIEVDSVAFPAIPRLTQLIDHVLAYMTGTDQRLRGPYETLDEYAAWFWKTAQSRDATYFKASVKDTVGDIIAVELHTQQYFAGAAHGIPATQYLNWQRTPGRVLALDEAIIPGRHDQFTAALRKVYDKWLSGNDDAKRDPAAYARTFPFSESDNFALTRDGVVIKYDAYSIAPYVYGEPELTIPYDALVGILKPDFLPKK
nr:RsiV family protein [Bordetella sp. LUAb4]